MPLGKGKNRWTPGRVISRIGRVVYCFEIKHEGRVMKQTRHVNQLRPTTAGPVNPKLNANPLKTFYDEFQDEIEAPVVAPEAPAPRTPAPRTPAPRTPALRPPRQLPEPGTPLALRRDRRPTKNIYYHRGVRAISSKREGVAGSNESTVSINCASIKSILKVNRLYDHAGMPAQLFKEVRFQI